MSFSVLGRRHARRRAHACTRGERLDNSWHSWPVYHTHFLADAPVMQGCRGSSSGGGNVRNPTQNNEALLRGLREDHEKLQRHQ